ncbi:MAG: type II toxin-antitoxin system RelE/ParE family toxin [Methanomicrobiales archaeon HGW-Methanomicrobiales-3]|nr:MAG: type II toxin-antitoxin system RelE/ParE family toxin [Methanomicrobiales archaeon HGW-Methanomicrobiales-3]
MYTVHLSRGAQKDLLAIPKKDARRIRAALNDLAAEENPQACVKKLKGHEHVPIYSCRIGSFRAILTIDNGILVIFVITIDHRSSVYRNV